MKREIIKIQQGNDTQLSIRALLPDGKTQVPIYPFGTQSAFRVNSVHFTINGHETEDVSYAVKDGLLVVTIPSTLPIAKYGIHVVGTMASTDAAQEPAIDCNFYEAFEIVPYSDNIRYDNYYTDLFIVGLPDSAYEQLRHELEQKVAEANALVQKLSEQIKGLSGIGYIGSPDDGEGTGTIFGKVREVAEMLGLSAYDQGSMSIYEEVETIRRLIGEGISVDLTPVLTAIAESRAVIDTTKTNTDDLKKRVPSNFPNKLASLIDAAETAAGGVGVDTGGEDWTLHDKIGEKPENESVFSILSEIRANTSLTAEQADIDWQNVQPA